jgi:hypothetical protein
MARREWAAMCDEVGPNALPYGHDLFLEQLVPFAEVVARAEGHGDTHLVLERELDL